MILIVDIATVTMRGPEPSAEDLIDGLKRLLHSDTQTISVNGEAGGFVGSQVAYTFVKAREAP